MSRASALLTDGVERVAEVKRVVEALKEWLPTEFHQHAHSAQTPTPAEGYQRLPRTSLTLPYMGGLSVIIRRILGPLDIKVVFRPHSTPETPASAA